AQGTNPRTTDPTHDIYLYNITNPANTGNLITVLKTPGIDYANSIWNGFIYAADGDKGFEVWRDKETDMKSIPPVVTLSTSAINGQVEEGKLFRVTANATDDGQVHNTEFYLDGNLIGNDGNFPFEIFFNTPQRAPGKESFTVRARAFDMGGNSTWSDPMTFV